MTLAASLIRSFAETFFGYGSWTAPYWFVGMEEGGVASIEEFENRVHVWDDDGRPALVDLVEFHTKIGVEEWFKDAPPLQRTWRSLIRAVQAATGRDTSPESLREYQAHRLGRINGETALLELLPLPNPTTKHWIYESLGIDAFSTRKKYVKALRSSRADQLIARIRGEKPRAVVFYGNAAFWRPKLGLQRVAPQIDTGRWGPTLVIATRHPAARGGASNQHWDAIASTIQSWSSQPSK
ncbi:MAG: hypothetical protein ABI779_18255 [Acidobacteriota bacterium]